MAHSFDMEEDLDAEPKSDPVLKPYSELEDYGSLYTGRRRPRSPLLHRAKSPLLHRSVHGVTYHSVEKSITFTLVVVLVGIAVIMATGNILGQ